MLASSRLSPAACGLSTATTTKLDSFAARMRDICVPDVRETLTRTETFG